MALSDLSFALILPGRPTHRLSRRPHPSRRLVSLTGGTPPHGSSGQVCLLRTPRLTRSQYVFFSRVRSFVDIMTIPRLAVLPSLDEHSELYSRTANAPLQSNRPFPIYVLKSARVPSRLCSEMVPCAVTNYFDFHLCFRPNRNSLLGGGITHCLDTCGYSD